MTKWSLYNYMVKRITEMDAGEIVHYKVIVCLPDCNAIAFNDMTCRQLLSGCDFL